MTTLNPLSLNDPLSQEWRRKKLDPNTTRALDGPIGQGDALRVLQEREAPTAGERNLESAIRAAQQAGLSQPSTSASLSAPAPAKVDPKTNPWTRVQTVFDQAPVGPRDYLRAGQDDAAREEVKRLIDASLKSRGKETPADFEGAVRAYQALRGLEGKDVDAKVGSQTLELLRGDDQLSSQAKRASKLSQQLFGYTPPWKKNADLPKRDGSIEAPPKEVSPSSGSACPDCPATPEASAEKLREAFRGHHDQIQRGLAEIEALLGTVRQRAEMQDRIRRRAEESPAVGEKVRELDQINT